ncbi:MAG: hypothetical protein O7B23_11015 [Deltaproteobacteria bacterium]|nr:hypothetical protein [Deltaproteobacteria bacterium]
MKVARLVTLTAVLATAAVGLALGFTALGQDTLDGETFYALDQESDWLEGCIVGPCLCPVALFDDLSGSFRLVEVPTLQPGPWRIFEVNDVRWKLRRGDQIVEIRGSGLYQTAAPVLDEQRLTLDLTLDGDPIEPLDTGTVEGGLAFPSIEVQALTPGQCYQEGVWLSADPLDPTPTPVPEPSARLLILAGVALLGLLALSAKEF